MKKFNTIKYKAALLGAALIWGSSFVFMKNSTDVLPPCFLLAIRFSIAFVILAIIFHDRLKVVNKTYLINGGVIGVFLFLAYCVQTFGLSETSPGKNAFLTAIYCVIVPFLYWYVKKKAPTKYNIIAALLTVVGIGLVSLTQTLSIGRGDFLTLIGGFLFAVHLVAITVGAKGKDPIVITIIQFGVTALLSWVGFMFTESLPPVSAFSQQTITEMLYLSVFSTAGALLLQNIGQNKVAPSSAALLISLESVFGVLFSIVFYHEPIYPKIVCGFVLIFVAIIISETQLSFLKKR